MKKIKLVFLGLIVLFNFCFITPQKLFSNNTGWGDIPEIFENAPYTQQEVLINGVWWIQVYLNDIVVYSCPMDDGE